METEKLFFEKDEDKNYLTTLLPSKLRFGSLKLMN